MIYRYKIQYKEKFSPEFDEYWEELIDIIKTYENFYFLNHDHHEILFIADDDSVSKDIFDYRNDNGKIYQKILEKTELDSGNDNEVMPIL